MARPLIRHMHGFRPGGSYIATDLFLDLGRFLVSKEKFDRARRSVWYRRGFQGRRDR
jgi:hypothetical protein